MKIDLNDQPINAIGWESTDGGHYLCIKVGEDGVDKIEAVEQYLGEYSIIWLQVWKNGRIVTRYNAMNVDSISYDKNEML